VLLLIRPPPARYNLVFCRVCSEAPQLTPPDGSSTLTDAQKEEAFAAFESVSVSK